MTSICARACFQRRNASTEFGEYLTNYVQIPLHGPDQTLSETRVYDSVSDKVRLGPLGFPTSLRTLSGRRLVRSISTCMDFVRGAQPPRSMHFKGQIPLERSDPTGPDRTRPDEYFRVFDQVSDQVSDMSSSTSETLSLTKSERFVT